MTDPDLARAARDERHAQHASAMTSKGRVEAFSDGVMAIAITLLTLDLVVPPESEAAGAGGLLAALLDRWPNYLAYLAAFLMIGIIWLNHRALIDKIRGFDHSLLWMNLFLLLTVAILPFPTATLAAYVRDGGANAATAASFLGLVASAMAGSWCLIWHHLREHPEMLEHGFGEDYAQRELGRSIFGLVVYAGSVVVGILAPLVALLGFLGIAVFYGLAREGAGKELRVRHEPAATPEEAPAREAGG